MRPKGKRHNTIPVPLAGMFSAGDISTIPDGTVRSLRNYMIRPNRLDCRAPFIYDSLNSVNGFAIWHDLVTEITKPVACNSTDHKLYTKNTNGIGYGTGLLTLPSNRLTSYTNFLQKLYMMFDDGAGIPTSAVVYDGSTINTTPFNTPVNARVVTAFNSRLFLLNPRVTVTNVLSSISLAAAYDWTGVGSSTWARVSCTASLIPSGSTSTCRVVPTATTGALAFTSVFAVTSADGFVVWRQDLRGVSATYAMPFTMQILMISPNWGNGVVTAVGTVIVDSNNNLQRCTVAGTTGGGAPAWAGSVGATTADNTVTWINDGINVIGSFEGTVPSASTRSLFSTYWAQAPIPPGQPGNVNVNLQFKFGNTASPTITLAPIDVSYRDGLADSNQAKRNYGSQLTKGDFYFPFFNQESSNVATVNIDAVIWSDLSNAKQILARNTFPLTEVAGLGTAACVCSGRYVAFKRRGMWIFKGVADYNEPILPETPAIRIGCLGPLALDVSRDDEMFWISENHICRMKIGDASPTEIDSPGMFEEIMNRSSSTWVESQSTYNLPLLAIDHANKDVWIYTQKGKIYIYSLQSQMWSYIDTNPTGTAAEVAAFIFDPVSGRMLVSFGGQAATRFDETSDAQDTIIAGGGTAWNVQCDIILKPFELFAPRYEASLLELGLFHLATLANGTLTPQYSYDRGTTWTTPAGYPVSNWITNPRIRLPLVATGESVTIKLARTGSGGARNWSISKLDALLRVHRGELPKVNAT